MWSLRQSEKIVIGQLSLTLNRAGGGGSKSKDRKSRLRAKNERLKDQRKRRSQEEVKQKNILKNDTQPARATGNNGDIHPSRRSRIATHQRISSA